MKQSENGFNVQQRLRRLARFLALGAVRVLRRLTRKKTDTARKPSASSKVSEA